ncbi:MAG: sigma 54-interacting transcriptional regulator [Acidobacteriota bacterium]
MFEEADGGTLLLDEVTETSPAFQVKLLRVLQEGEFRPLGTNSKKRVNVRMLVALERYAWLGNVRELKHLMQQLAALSSGIIRIEDLPPEFVSTPRVASVMNEVIPDGDMPTLGQLESSYLLRVLSAVGGNKSRAAQVMGVDRKTLYRMIERQVDTMPDRRKVS